MKCLLTHKKDTTCSTCTFKNCINSTIRHDHGILACPNLLVQLASEAKVTDATAISVNTTKRSCSVALPSLTAQIESSTQDATLKVVGVLLDTAAQQSLIHRSVVERLGIKPIRQEFTSLVGFGMTRPVTKAYDVVQVKLFKNNYQHTSTITCLVVDRHPAVCKMTGLCLLAKKLAKKGADIGDVRLLNQKVDVLYSDILLGADYYMSVYCAQKPPVKLLGHYLLNTIFGQCIIGKIAGSTKLVESTAVSQLSIVHVATDGIVEEDFEESVDSLNRNPIISEESQFSDKVVCGSIGSNGCIAKLSHTDKINLSVAQTAENSKTQFNSKENMVPEILDTNIGAFTVHSQQSSIIDIGAKI